VVCRRIFLLAFAPLPVYSHQNFSLSTRHFFKTTISPQFTDHVGAAPQDLSEEFQNAIRPSLFQRLRIRPTILLSRSKSRTRSPTEGSASPSGSSRQGSPGGRASPNVFAPPESFNAMIPSSLTVTPPAPPSKRQRSRESRTLSGRPGSAHREIDDGPPPSPGLRIPAFLNRTKAGSSSLASQHWPSLSFCEL
jgi:hypothetical protein